MSIASRVVPAMSETITRSSPSSAFTSDDLPTFGRPITARRRRRRPPRPRRDVGQVLGDASSRSPAAEPLRGRHRDRVAQAERVELGRRRRCRATSSTLLAATSTGTVGAAQLGGQLGVAGAQAGARVDHQHDDRGLGHRLARLRLDRAGQVVLLLHVDAARVDQQEAPAVPLGLDLLAVARDARLLVHDGLARAGQAVDERRLADVRVADDGDLGQGHQRSLPLAGERGDLRRRPRRSSGRWCRPRRRRRRPSAASARAAGPAGRAASGRAGRSS